MYESPVPQSPRRRYGLLEVRGTVVQVHSSSRPGGNSPNPLSALRALPGLTLLAVLVMAALWVRDHVDQMVALAALLGLWTLGLHFLLRALGVSSSRLLGGLLSAFGALFGVLFGLLGGAARPSAPGYRDGGVVQVLLVQDAHGRQHTLFLALPPHRFYALPGHELSGWGSRWRGGTRLIGAHNLSTGQSVGL